MNDRGMTGQPTETAPRRRRRWWLWVPLTLVLLLLLAVVGVSWYASGLIADEYRADQPESAYSGQEENGNGGSRHDRMHGP